MFDTQNTRDQLVSTLKSELERIKNTLLEIRGQIDQTKIVVNREQQRNADIVSELRTIQDNIETVPRQDIKVKYDEALDARFRLTTMRGQLEKFQATQQQLEEQQKMFSQILSALTGIDMLPSGDEATSNKGGRGAASGALNIVRIIQAQEEEKQRLARMLHDGPAQSLTNFILQTEICQRLFDRDPARAAEELSNLKSNAGSTFQKVRDFIFDLRPMMLDDLGVISTLRRFAGAFQEKYDIETKFDTAGEEVRFETHREVILFRTVQELMGHARDSAKAKQLLVSLDVSKNQVKAEVTDNGRGFDVDYLTLETDPPTEFRERVQGILTLKEKLELIGGDLSVESNETDGTTVRFNLPMHDEF